jgi:DNA-binding MarR family transcriptional regulator
MPKLKEKQIEVLQVLSTKTKMTPAQVAEKADSYPGPMAHSMNAMESIGLVKSFGNEEDGYTYKRTAAGTKAMKAGAF